MKVAMRDISVHFLEGTEVERVWAPAPPLLKAWYAEVDPQDYLGLWDGGLCFQETTARLFPA